MSKNIILFLGSVEKKNIDEVRNFEQSQKTFFRTALLTSKSTKSNKKPPKWQKIREKIDFVFVCDITNIKAIKKTIASVKDEIAIVFCFYDSRIPVYARLVKLLPEVNMPSKESLKICNSKFEMRKKFMETFPEITPKFMLVRKKESTGKIAKEIGFPCITKPFGLSKSRLVMKSNNISDLEENLQNTFEKINEVYKSVFSECKPKVLAEEFMEGKLYSIDAYVSPKGHIYFTPIVRIVTGKDIGIDDFFNYCRVTPAKVSEKEEKRAQEASTKAIKATGPTSVTMHIELIRTHKGKWKIVELQTRPGGYRNEMLKLSFGIKHNENDFLNKMGKKPIIPRKTISYTAVLEIFPEKSGRMVSINGIEEIKKLPSFLSFEQAKDSGDICGFSRDGHTYVLQVIFNHKEEKILYEDIDKIRNIIKIIIK